MNRNKLYICQLMRKNNPFLFALLSLVFISCENDIDINAPWQETPVVYGFIDPNQATQYLRIQKTYQNSTDLTTAEGAQISDSLYFKDLHVTVITPSGPITFLPDTSYSIPKDPGFFANTKHLLYKATFPQAANNLFAEPGKSYRLQIFSPLTNKTYTSNTICLGASNVSAASLNFRDDPNSKITITVSLPTGSFTTTGVLRFNYREYPTGNIGLAESKYVDFDLEGYNRDRFSISSINYVNTIRSKIPVKSGYTREVVSFDLIVVGGGREVLDYMEIMKPSTMVAQKKLEYSNIEGGLGIFSSKSEKTHANLQLLSSTWEVSTPTSPAQKTNLINLLNTPVNLGF